MHEGEKTMRYFEKIPGKEIYLSPINPEDYETYCAWVNDYETSVLIGAASKVTGVDKEKELLQRFANEGYAFAIVARQGDRMVGSCSLFDLDHVDGTAELGILIGDKDARGRGYGTECVRLLVGYAFEVLRLNNIMLRTFDFNENARKAYSKAGFKEFGRRRQSYYCGNGYHDEVYMDILREEYRN